MKVLQINIFGNLSTGRIAVDLHRSLVSAGHEGMVAFARNAIADDVPHIRIGNAWDVRVHGAMTRITDRAGFYSKSATQKLIAQIREYDPDIIHLHNLHGYYLNIDVLFRYLKTCGKPVIWTLHDCWAYTGHCCYYSMAGCSRWETGCRSCPQKKAYPASLLMDSSAWNYKKKRELFLNVPNLTLVPVSEWLGNEVRRSFLKDYPIRVICNGIDREVFRPTQSNFREKYGLQNKKIVLGVASTWDVRKGLNDFVKLSATLDESYKIVVVGVSREQISKLPENILAIPRTDSVEELAAIYTAADVFFNASREETFGLPTVEAAACGTPAIVYNATAMPETVDGDTGVIVPVGNLERVAEAIAELCGQKKRVVFDGERFDKQLRYRDYIALYEEVLKEKRG